MEEFVSAVVRLIGAVADLCTIWMIYHQMAESHR